MVQVVDSNGMPSTHSVTNTTPPYGTVKAPLKGTAKSIYLGGDNIAKNNIDDVYIKLRDTWFGKKEYKATDFGWVTRQGGNSIEIGIGGLYDELQDNEIIGVTYKTSSEVNPEM